MNPSPPGATSALPNIQRRRLNQAALILGALALAACATAPTSGPSNHWEGRLGLLLDSQPPEQFFAGFSLRGNEHQGELELSTPLGSLLALLHWEPGQAWLRQGEDTRHYPSLDTLVSAVTGTAIPVRALFAWLHGQPAQVPGWQADLSRLADGRLTARRTHPTPHAELRLILQQP